MLRRHRRVTLFALGALAACTPRPGTIDAGALDTSGGPPRDAGSPLDADDAPEPDAGVGAPDAPPGCGTPPPDAGPGPAYTFSSCSGRAFDLDDPSTYDTPTELGAARASLVCEHQMACGIDGGRGCDPMYFGRFGPEVGLRDPVDVVRARACLEALLARGCGDDELRVIHACRPLEIWGYGEGSDCSEAAWCDSGNCERASPDCSGVCGPPPPPCDSACCPAGERCVADRCQPPSSLHGPCVPWCADGLFCHPATFTCEVPPAEGEPCLVHPNPVTLELISYCAEGLGCDDRSMCVVPIRVEVGEECGPSRLCPSGAECFFEDPSRVRRVCAPLPRNGEPCRWDRRCASPNYCNGASLCAPLVAPGCACDDTVTCTRNYRCALGVCTRIGIISVPCAPGECDDGACSASSGGICLTGSECGTEGLCPPHTHCAPGSRCAPDIARGESCALDELGCAHPWVCRGGLCAPLTEAYSPCDSFAP